MIATETAYTAGDLPDDLDPLMSLVSEQIPAGVGKGRDLGYSDGYRDVFGLVGIPFSELSEKQQQKAITQFGTLGSGNHFVEVSLDERGKVWTVLAPEDGRGQRPARFRRLSARRWQVRVAHAPDLHRHRRGHQPEFGIPGFRGLRGFRPGGRTRRPATHT
jgi:hypothetical protein